MVMSCCLCAAFATVGEFTGSVIQLSIILSGYNTKMVAKKPKGWTHATYEPKVEEG